MIDHLTLKTSFAEVNSDRSKNLLCNSNQLRKAQIITGNDDGDVAFDNAGLVVADSSLEHTVVGVQPIQVLRRVGLCSQVGRLGDVLRIRGFRVGSGRELYVALDALIGVLGNAGHLICAKGHCHTTSSTGKM